jgi:hypothetical protein
LVGVTSSSSGIPLTEVSPWNEAFVLGAGVDVLTGEVADTAVEPFKLDASGVAAKARQKILKIENDNDFDREISVSASGSYNMEGVTFSGSASYLNSVQYSDKSTTLLIVYETSTHQAELASSYLLTSDAKNLMAKPDEFRARYGDYFVAGAWRGSYFYGVYTCHATTAKSMDDFKASLAAKTPDLFSAEGTASFKQQMASHSVSYSSEVFWDGFKNTATRPKLEKDPDPQQMFAYYNWFIDNLEGAPVKAYLRHYSALDSSYPVTIDVDPNVFVGLKRLYRTIRQISARLDGSLPQQVTRPIANEKDNLVDESDAAGRSVLLKDEAKLANCQKRADSLLTKLDNIAARRAFYDKVKGSYLPGNGWNDSGHRGSWSYGFSAYPNSDAVVVRQTDYEHYLAWYEDQPTGYGGYIYHDFQFNNPNALIVGFEIVSDWTDGLNGQWKLPSDPLLQNQGLVSIRSEKFRGTNWRCRWFYVDAKDYQFA